MQVCQTFVTQLKKRGAELYLNTAVQEIFERENQVGVVTNKQTFIAKFIVNCTGLHSDRVTKLAGVNPDVKIIP